MAKKGLRGRKIGRALLAVIVLAGVGWFAVQGGEYGTFDLFSQRASSGRLKAEIATLQKSVDSLVAWKKSILTDPAVQERLAREEFGMVRGNKELLYRFLSPRDSVR